MRKGGRSPVGANAEAAIPPSASSAPNRASTYRYISAVAVPSISAE
jgi:hypothetical protein